MHRFRYLLALLLAGFMGAAVAQNVTLRALFMQQAAYSDSDVRSMTADFEAQHPGVKVDVEFVSYEALHNKIITAAAAGGGGYDVVLFDVIWPAEFAQNHVLRDITGDLPQSMIDQVVPGAWTTVTYDGHYYGIPWILDTKYLFYNKDMLAKAGITAPPKTWQELLDQAKAIKDAGIVQYPIVWSWGQAEAIVCDYTTLLSAFGGSFFDNGQPAFNSGGGLEALQFMRTSLDEGLSNPASTESLEEDVRRIFSSGQAAFALNWTYMYNLANDPKESQVAGQVEVAPAPGDGVHSQISAVNGSMGLGITTGSNHPTEALQYIQYLTSQAVQEKYAKLSLPIWKASYDNPAVAQGQESLIAAAKQSLGVMYPRPLLIQYPQFSTWLQTDIHRALLSQTTPKEALDNTAKQVVQDKLD
ncbi:MAG TPA: extracellular solute-binding protein [Trueperaceae bacterium]|nr:extracellular solute-binding protein [Trueperaceae bacterium]